MKNLVLLFGLVLSLSAFTGDGDRDVCANAISSAKSTCSPGGGNDDDRTAHGLFAEITEDFKQCVNQEVQDIVDQYNKDNDLKDSDAVYCSVSW